MISDVEAAKRIILQNYKVYHKPIRALELAKLLSDSKGMDMLCNDVEKILADLKRGGALDGDSVLGYVPLYVEVED